MATETHAQLLAEYNADLKQAGLLKAVLNALIAKYGSGTLGESIRPAPGEQTLNLHQAGGGPGGVRPTLLETYGLQNIAYTAPHDVRAYYYATAQKLLPLINRIQYLYGVLYPPASLSQLEEILSVVGIAAAGVGAYEVGAYEGATAAGVGATSSASAPAVGQGATAAELGTTAGAATAPLVVSGSSAAVGAATTAAAGATTAGSVASSVGSAVTDLTGSSTVGGIASNLVSGIGSYITDIEQFLKPVTDLASTVLNDVEAINKNYILPLTTTIQTDYNTVNGLVGEIHQLANSGIQGILAIPSAISQALTSIDASNQRLVAMQEQANTKIATDTLVPGIGGAIANPLAMIHQALQDAANNPEPSVGAVTLDTLNELAFDISQWEGLIDRNTGQVKGKGLAFDLINAFLIMVRPLFTVFGFGDSLISYAKQLGDTVNPLHPLDPGSIVRAWWRGNLTPEQAGLELKRHGLDSTRAKLLHDVEQWVPSPADALNLWFRRVINTGELNAALAKQGYSEADASAILQGAYAAIGARGVLESQGIATSLAQGFLQESLGSAVSQNIKDVYDTNKLQVEQAQLDWLRHFDIQNMGWWLTAYFRGYASQDEVNLAAQAHNIPRELWDKLPLVEQETIQLWMIPDMIASNLFTEAEALSYLHYIGIADRDAALIIKYGLAKANAGHATDALGLAGVSIGLAAQMFDDGIINESEYVDILEAHKLEPQAAALTVQLTKQKNDLAARRANAEALVKQVGAGVITLAEMQSTLYKGGYTQAEVNTYTAKAENNAVQKAKNPTAADIEKFAKAGLLTYPEALDALKVDGWSETWATKFLTLWGIKSV